MKAQKGKVLSTPFSLPFFSLVQQHGRTVVVKNAGSVLSSRALSAQVRVRVEGGGGGGRGGGDRRRASYSQKNWMGLCGPLPKTLSLFLTKICDHVRYPILI